LQDREADGRFDRVFSVDMFELRRSKRPLRRTSMVAFRNRHARFWQAGFAPVARIGGYAASC